MTWPSIQAPSYPLGEEVYKPVVRSEFESGAVQSRARATVAKERFSLKWDLMSASDYASLKAAFIADQGSTFSWTHPATATAYTVRYVENSLQSEVVVNSLRKVSVTLEEA